MPGGVPVREIAPDEVRRRLEAGEQVTVVDIREPYEWQSGAIGGARLSPMRPFLLQELSSLDQGQEYILVCASGVRTLEAAAFMTLKGFPNVRSMAGGMKAWKGPVVPPSR